MKYLIGLDLGSGSIRAGAFDLNGKVAAIAARPSVSEAPDPSKPDHIVWPHRIVWESVCAVLHEVRGMLHADAEIVGVAAACLGMDGLPVDRDGNELYDFIAWLDGRCSPYYEAWVRDFGEARQFLSTGTPARSFSTMFRLQWMADNHPEILERTHKWVLMGDYVNYCLCGALAVDYSMAACTLLFDPTKNGWHPEIAQAAGIDLGLMCDPKPSGTVLGKVSSKAAGDTGLPEGTPVVLGGHDYLCGVLPVGGNKPGTIVNVGGTWEIIQAALPEFSVPEQAAGTGWTIEPHVAPDTYSAFGAAIGGAVSGWFRGQFAQDLTDEAYFELSRKAAAQPPGSVLFLPHLAGATGPIVDLSAAGAFLGLRMDHTRTELLSAVFEGLNFQNREILQSVNVFGIDADQLVFVGGNTKNPALVQSKADVLGMPVDVPDLAETTALGAALIAGLGTGVFSSVEDAVEAMRPSMSRVEPDPEKTTLYDARFEIYRDSFDALRDVHASLGRHSHEF